MFTAATFGSDGKQHTELKGETVSMGHIDGTYPASRSLPMLVSNIERGALCVYIPIIEYEKKLQAFILLPKTQGSSSLDCVRAQAG